VLVSCSSISSAMAACLFFDEVMTSWRGTNDNLSTICFQVSYFILIDIPHKLVYILKFCLVSYLEKKYIDSFIALGIIICLLNFVRI
jgi:hypothetical protein